MREIVLEVSKNILIVGGALSMILFVIILMIAISILLKLRGLIRSVEEVSQLIKNFVLTPITYVNGFFGDRKKNKHKK